MWEATHSGVAGGKKGAHKSCGEEKQIGFDRFRKGANMKIRIGAKLHECARAAH